MEQYLYSIIVALFGGLAWFVKAKMTDYDTKLTKSAAAISEIIVSAAALAQQLHDHAEVDKEQFSRIEDMLKEGREDLKEILRNVKR